MATLRRFQSPEEQAIRDTYDTLVAVLCIHRAPDTIAYKLFLKLTHPGYDVIQRIITEQNVGTKARLMLDSSLLFLTECTTSERRALEYKNFTKTLKSTGGDFIRAAVIMLQEVYQQNVSLESTRTEPKLERLGKRGGFGEVYKVTGVLDNGCALAGKLFHETTIRRDDFLTKWDRELQILQACDHDNVVKYYGKWSIRRESVDGFQREVPLILMELMDMDFQDYFLLDTASFQCILKVLEQVACGLDYLHTHDPQIVHRDLTARNVLLKLDTIPGIAPLAKITDFGNSRFMHYDHTLTTMTTMPGILFYIDPNLSRRNPHCNEKVDIFSFGHLSLSSTTQCVIDKLLPPDYPDPRNPDKYYARTQAEMRREYFNRLRIKVGHDSELESLIVDCLHRNHTKRPSAAELAMKLSEFSQTGVSEHAKAIPIGGGNTSTTGSAISYSGIN